jgi:beta-lactamase regulating signal transducer with metallopeptidase domain
MNAIDNFRAVVAAAMHEPVLSRLLLASVEFAVLAFAVGCFLWLCGLKSPRARALIWMLALAKPVASLLVGSPVYILRLEPPVAAAIAAQANRATDEEHSLAATPAVAESATPDSRVEPNEPNTHSSDNAIVIAPGKRTPEFGLAPPSISVSRALLGVWLLGATLFACRALIDRLRLVRLIVASQAPGAELAAQYRKIASALRVRRTPRLLETEELESPALAGLVVPVIFVPSWLAREKASAKLDWALKHELMHFQHLDHLANFVREVAQILFFFHPAAWWVGRKWEEAAELACDRAIIASQDESHDYAEQLYQMLVVVRDRRQLRLGAGLFATRTQIGRRIAALLAAPLAAPSKLSAATIATLVALSILTLSIGVGFAEKAGEEQKEPANPAAADEPKETFTIAGQVFDPDGKPISGVHLRLEYYRITQPATEYGPSFGKMNDADGKFQLDVPKSALQKSGRPFYWNSARIVATREGYGFDDQLVATDHAFPRLQLVPDEPIHGRILDIEGRPIAGAKLRVKTVRWTPGESLDTTIDERRDGRYTNRQTRVSRGPAVEGEVVTTGSDGRFRLAGVGAERLVSLQLEGPGIQYSSLEVATRDMKNPVSAAGIQQRLYGANFEHLAAPSRVISGVVRDQATGRPIVGAAVHGMTHHTAITDESGRYQLLGYAKSPRYDLQVFPPDGQPYFRASVTLPDTPGLSPLEKDIELSSGTIVRGRLTDGFTGRPIVGRVEYHSLFPNEHVAKLERVGRPASATAISGDGQYAISVFPGPGVLAFKSDGVDDSNYAPAFISAEELKEFMQGKEYGNYEERFLQVAAGGQARSIISQSEYRALLLINPEPGQQSLLKDVALERAARVRGVVLGSDGQPLAGATLIGLPPSAFSLKRLKTAEFEVSGLNPKQPHPLLFMHEEQKLGAPLTVRGDESEPVMARLQPFGSATGRLVNEDGEPMPNTTLDFCRPRMYGPGIRTAKTDGEGRFQVEGLAPGQKFDVIIWGGPYVTAIYRDLSVAARETKDLGDVRARNIRVMAKKQ